MAGLQLKAVTVGSFAMTDREPCQMGNQAAISGCLLCAEGQPGLSLNSKNRVLSKIRLKDVRLFLKGV